MRWLSARGYPGVERLADALARSDERGYADLAPADAGGVWQSPAGRLCPLISGAALCDRALDIAEGRAIELGATSQPLLLAPFAAGVARLTGTTIMLAWDDVVMTLMPDGENVDGNRDALNAGSTQHVRCHRTDLVNEPAAPVGSALPIDDAAWNRLAVFAGRIFAPATEASRLTGAGDGTGDDN